ncbi:MAG: ROK family protein [Marinilabiliales bacterium]|nr:MAG: ROK family protein [Marinilabiliales bacterium]
MVSDDKTKGQTVIGVDMGGTKIRTGKVKDNQIIAAASDFVPKTDKEQEVTDMLIKLIRQVFDKEVSGIGVGVPSLVDAGRGIVYNVQNIPAWKEVYLKDVLEKEFNVPVYVNNDANCFATGERFFGKGRDYEDFVGLICGTGLGAGIIKGGHLMPDTNCGSGEFGEIYYLDSIFEHYASGQFFERQFGVSGDEMAKRAGNGDQEAEKAFSEFAVHLGKAIKTIMLAVDPAAIIMGGGVSESYEFYRDALWKEIQDFPYPKSAGKLKILITETQEIALLGAAALYFNATV